ncbi:MAG: hypothetical protein ABTA16_04200 [Niallia sp.]
MSNIKPPNIPLETQWSMYEFFLEHSAPLLYEKRMQEKKELKSNENQYPSMEVNES